MTVTWDDANKMFNRLLGAKYVLKMFAALSLLLWLLLLICAYWKLTLLLVPGPQDRWIWPSPFCQGVHDLLWKVLKSLDLGKMSQLRWLCVDSLWETLVLEGNRRAMEEHSCRCQENIESRKGACMCRLSGHDWGSRRWVSLPTAYVLGHHGARSV